MFHNATNGKLRVWCLIPASLLAMNLAISTATATAQQDLNEGQRREVLQNLERGASALRTLGRHDEAEHLLEIARQLNPAPENRDRPRDREQNRQQDREQNRERSAADRPGPDRERDDRPSGDRPQNDRPQNDRPQNDRPQNDRPQNDRLSIEHQLDVFRMAHHAFREAERVDAIEMVERVIHGLEMQQTGRRDDESQQAIREMPGRGDQVELLVAASRFWDENGHEQKAEALKTLTEQFQQRGNRSRDVERPEPRDQPSPPERLKRDRQAGDPAGQNRQMEEVHQHLQRLSEQIEQLQRQMNELRDRR